MTFYSFTQTSKKHILGIGNCLKSIREFGLTIRPKKSHVAVKKVTFLGYAIKDGKITPDSSLLTKIMKIQIPKTKKQVRSLLRLIHFYRVFVPRYAEIVSCLNELITGKSPNIIHWTTKHDDALKQIQTVLNTPPYLKIPYLCLKFHMFADSSDFATASTLCHCIDGIYHPTKYYSTKLSSAHQKWSTGERENATLS